MRPVPRLQVAAQRRQLVHLAPQPQPGLALAAYKLAFTLDLPLRGAVLGARYLAARLRGKERAALRARRELAGLAYFVRHALAAFWRA